MLSVFEYAIFVHAWVGVKSSLEQEAQIAELFRLDLRPLDIIFYLRHQLVEGIDSEVIAHRQSGFEEYSFYVVLAQLLG